jgi:hypothetical protein
MRGEHAIRQTDMIPQPPCKLLKSNAHTLLVLPVRRFNELGHLCSPRVVLLLVPLKRSVPRAPHRSFFTGEVKGKAPRQSPQMESDLSRRRAHFHCLAHSFGVLEDFLMIGIKLWHEHEIVGRPL